mmetsp:Transcript_3450/g.3408  ORF Transcript_3450/g.3408 Transcript_3450/m.3408 type:complete len:153 (+) Transcript_3450:70-528(+)
MMGNIPHEDKQVNLMAGEQYTEEYQKINPLNKVPTLIDGSFHLGESSAIAKYLCTTNKEGFSQCLYPEDLKERAEVDSLLDWVQSKLYPLQADSLESLMMFKAQGKPRPEALGEFFQVKEKKAFNEFSILLGKKEGQYLCGDKVTLADLSAF